MSKNSRSGGKYSGSHSTVIDVAVPICDIAAKCPEVTKISLGFIKSGLKSARGGRRVKITGNENVLLAIRGNTSQQEVRIYTQNVHDTKLAIARGARKKGLRISFDKKVQKK